MPLTDAPRLLYPISEAAHRLGIGRTALYELIGSGQIRALKIKSRTVIHADDLARFAASLSTN
jgi:excisionase family DNA binding protein